MVVKIVKPKSVSILYFTNIFCDVTKDIFFLALDIAIFYKLMFPI